MTVVDAGGADRQPAKVRAKKLASRLDSSKPAAKPGSKRRADGPLQSGDIGLVKEVKAYMKAHKVSQVSAARPPPPCHGLHVVLWIALLNCYPAGDRRAGGTHVPGRGLAVAFAEVPRQRA
jgi:hypothetical protein